MTNSYPDDENPDDKWNQPEPDYKHYLAFDFNKVRWGPLTFNAFQKLKQIWSDFILVCCLM